MSGATCRIAFLTAGNDFLGWVLGGSGVGPKGPQQPAQLLHGAALHFGGLPPHVTCTPSPLRCFIPLHFIH